MANPLSKLIHPWYPSNAIGFEKGLLTMVQLERGKTASTLKRAATVSIPESLIRPSFDEANISDPSELAAALNELATTAGLLQRKRWSASLPDASSRSLIMTLDSNPGSHAELEEVLNWKVERGFGAPLEELSVSRERLPPDVQGRGRYLMVATRSAVLAEYESVLGLLGWRAGLVLPRHVAESQWLTLNGSGEDALLLSSAATGFTAVVFRGKQPLIIRTVMCEPDECEDELYRLLLFYRDKRAGDGERAVRLLGRLLVVGDAISKERISAIVRDTLGVDLRPLEAEDLGLQLSTRQLSFDSIAAPAGLAILSWQ
jgi:Tfp pilus assembly PilM family ATPase